jgi:hypothetical protein
MDARKPALGCLGFVLLLILGFAVFGSLPDDPGQVEQLVHSVQRLNLYLDTINPSRSYFLGATPRRWDAQHLRMDSVTIYVTDDWYYASRLFRLRRAEILYDWWAAAEPRSLFKSIRFSDPLGNEMGEIDRDGYRD